MRYLLLSIILIFTMHCSAQGKEHCSVRITSEDGTKPIELVIYKSSEKSDGSNVRIKHLDVDTVIALEDVEVSMYSISDEGEIDEKGSTRRFGKFFVENGASVDISLSAAGLDITSTGKEFRAWNGLRTKVMDAFADELAEIQAKGDKLTDSEAEALSRKMYDWQYDYCARNPMLGFLLDLDNDLSHFHFADNELIKKIDVYKHHYTDFYSEHSVHKSIAAHLREEYQIKGGVYNDFTVRNMDGDTVRASEFFRDRVTMVICWATWCLPCRKDALDAVAVFEKYKDRGLAAFSLAHEFTSPDNFRKAVTEDNLPWPSLYDLDDEFDVFKKHGTSNVAYFLIDRKGTIVATAWSSEELEPAIAALLAE